MIQVHSLGKFIKRSQRVGRGGRRGKNSGRGAEGQKKRAGRKLKPAWKETLLRLPKLRGEGFPMRTSRPAPVDLAAIAKKFPEGAFIGERSLRNSGLISRNRGAKTLVIKVLGNGPLTKRFVFSEGLLFSGAARQAIEKSGGTFRGK